MKILSHRSERPRSTGLVIREVAPDSEDLERLFTRDGALDRGFIFVRSRFDRLGGQYLVGYVNNEPVCTSGWYVIRGIARLRRVYTALEARGRGYAGTLIQHICGISAVRNREAVALLVDRHGPEKLYEQLGFRTRGYYYEAFQDLPGSEATMSGAVRRAEKHGRLRAESSDPEAIRETRCDE